MGKRKPKRLFPRHMQAHVVHTPRIDSAGAAIYNNQRSKATTGPRSSSEHNLDSNFMHEVPRTKSLSMGVPISQSPRVRDPHTGKKKHWPDGFVKVRSERGKTVDTMKEIMDINHWVKEGNLLKLYRLWVSDAHAFHGIVQWNEYHYIDEPGHKFVLYFSGELYLFVHEMGGMRFISCTYKRERNLLMEARYRYNNKINWVVQEGV